MLKKIITLSLSVLFPYITFANNHEFNDITIFGDSISDVGNTSYKSKTFNPKNDQPITIIIEPKYIAGMNINKVYSEWLSEALIGKEIIASKNGGTDHAMSNGTALGNSYLDIKQQFAAYFASQPKISPRDLFILWIGGNDYGYSLNPQGIWKSINGELTNNVSTTIAEYSQQLVNYGAKTIVVPNLFNLGVTPSNIGLIFNITDTVLQLPTQLIPISSLRTTAQESIHLLSKMLFRFPADLFLRTINHSPTEGQAGKTFYREFYANFYHGFLGPIAVNVILKILDIQSKNSADLRLALQQKLLPLNGYIIDADIYSLFNELTDNPQLYGYTDIVFPQCSFALTTLYEIQDCSSPSVFYNDDGNYLWTDRIHPSPFTHIVYANYIESLVTAPIHAISLSRQLDNFQINAQESVLQEIYGASNVTDIHKFIPIVSIGGMTSKIGVPFNYRTKFDNSFVVNLGGMFYANGDLLLGSMLTLSAGTARPYHQYRFRQQTGIINLFAKNQLAFIHPNLWTIFAINFGYMDASDIKRSIVLGYANRVEESSNTHAKNSGVMAMIGYDFQDNETSQLSAYVKLNWQNVSQKAYRENEMRSTSMHFSEFNYHHTETSLGLKNTFIRPNYQGIITGELIIPIDGNHTTIIQSGLNTSPLYHNREINFRKKPAIKLTAALNKTFTNKITLQTNLSARIDKQKNMLYGYEAKFRYNL